MYVLILESCSCSQELEYVIGEIDEIVPDNGSRILRRAKQADLQDVYALLLKMDERLSRLELEHAETSQIKQTAAAKGPGVHMILQNAE